MFCKARNNYDVTAPCVILIWFNLFVKFFKDFVDCFWTVCCKWRKFLHKKKRFCKDLAAFFLNVDLRKSWGTSWYMQRSRFDRSTEKCAVSKSIVNALIVSSKFVPARRDWILKTRPHIPSQKTSLFPFQNAALSCKLGYALFKCWDLFLYLKIIF